MASKARQGVLFIGIGTVALLGWAISSVPAAPSTTTSSTTQRAQVGISDARRICEKYVVDRLKAPATAKFSPAQETPGGDTGHGWVVSGWVDSQNGFGALIRSKYGCQVTFNGMSATGTPTWTLDNIAIVDP